MACKFRVCHNLKKKEDVKMIKAGIIGATGYAGAELVRILMGHPSLEIKWYGSRSYIDKKYAYVYRNQGFGFFKGFRYVRILSFGMKKKMQQADEKHRRWNAF